MSGVSTQFPNQNRDLLFYVNSAMLFGGLLMYLNLFGTPGTDPFCELSFLIGFENVTVGLGVRRFEILTWNDILCRQS